MKGKRIMLSVRIIMVLLFGCLGIGRGYAQKSSISGTVVDTQNNPVIGASVMVVGNNTLGTVTDVDGKFSLSVPGNASINVSCIGYESQTVAVGTQTVFKFILKEDSEFLEETVVIGYGVQRKSDITGAIASVKSSDLENRTATDAAQALQGKAAGVQIVNASGAPGSSSAIQIRGYSSNSKTSPLIIVDGLKVKDLSYLDPENIASMEILKDAASAAIYGIEAGNGVILITTKSGKGENGKGRVFYNYQNTSQTINQLPELMNAQEFMDYLVLTGANKVEDFDYDGKTDTNWAELMFEKGHMTKHTIGFEGANDRAKLYMSLSYTDNNGIISGDKDTFRRLTGTINAEYKINDWFTVGTNNTIEKSATSSVSESQGANISLLGSILTYDPITPWSYAPGTEPARITSLVNQGYPLPKDENGNYYGSTVFGGNSLIWHPAVMRDRTDSQTKRFQLRGTAYINFTPIKGLVITSRLGYRAGYSQTSTYNYNIYVNAKENQAMSISGNARNTFYYQWENFANYNKTIAKKHSVSAMAGMSYQQSDSDFVRASANTLSNDDPNFRYLNNAVNSNQMAVGGQPDTQTNMSYFGRLGYTFDNRYFIQANFRADAYDTSKLDKDHRWGYFPSVSGGWNVSNEKFMDSVKARTGITFLKIRASWGVNGNVNALGSYQYQSTLGTAVNQGADFGDGHQITGVYPSSVLPNPEIKWETSRQLDLGLDLRMFSERLSFTLDWYNKNTHDLLTSTTAPGHTGASTIYVNAGRVNNHGTEIEISWKDKVGELGYGISGNIATLHNEVTEGTSSDRVEGAKVWSSEYVTYFEAGYPLWYLRTYTIDSIDPQTGKPVYHDYDGLPGITTEDRSYAGSAIPKFTYGLTINLDYKGFDFTVYGAGSQGAKKLFALNRGDFPQQNTLREFYTEAWQSPDSKGYKYPKPDASDKLYKVSNYRVFDASFFKIKQIQLGYNVPKKIISRAKLSGLRAYVSLDDWFTFTKYPGLDPETNGLNYSAGAGGESTTGAGMAIDFGSYPISKKVVFGVNVSF